MSSQARPTPHGQAASLSPRLAQAHIDALIAETAAPRRAVIVGGAGSGKSRTIRHLHREFTARRLDVTLLRPGGDPAGLASSPILLVDDAQLLDAAQLAAVGARVEDPDAGVVLARRPWPTSHALRAISGELEKAQPAVVLGHISRADVVAHLGATDRTMAPSCIDDILDLAGHVTWLVAEALTIHDHAGCRGAGDHAPIADALEDVIAHRLGTVEPALGAMVEALCLLPNGDGEHGSEGRDELVLAGHAEGLLLRNGRPVPLVRAAVRATTPVERRIHLYLDASGGVDDPLMRELIGGVADTRVAAALLRQGDALLARDPHAAAECYRGAAESGAEPASVAVRRADAAWALGDIDAAGSFLDSVAFDDAHPDVERARRTAAAVWAARGCMATSNAILRATPALAPATAGFAAVAALAAADPACLDELRRTDPGAEDAPAARVVPSALAVSMDLLRSGLRYTVSGASERALSDLVRASEMYTASGCTAPAPEAPAVVAALAALHLGEVEVADSVLVEALAGRQSGRWARNRLLLWRAWVALQRQHLHDVDSAVEEALSSGHPLSRRDQVLLDAITVARARRYADAAGLTAAWRTAREGIVRTEFDLFSILPLGEFVVTAARTGDTARVRPHFDRILEHVRRLGPATAWSAHVHWAGIQQGILLNRPGDLKPHAHQLVAAAPHNRLAEMMAQAGRVWTSVLAGHVDADGVEVAAYGLASVGLAWDGARLAGHGAGRTDDRREISRLLACARHLHPREEIHALEAPDEATPARPRPDSILSHREHEVAVLVLQGKTYAEIGETIFISPRTAEHHIARIRRRLGATSRSDLISKLRVVVDDDRDVAREGRRRNAG